MSIKKIVDEVWKDEVLRENKITKREIKLILEAFKRYIPEKIVENGEFSKFQDRWKSQDKWL